MSEEQDARWAENFSEILNRPPPETEPDIQVAVVDLDIETKMPSKEEIINAIKALKNNKAPGPDNLNEEPGTRPPLLKSRRRRIKRF